MKRLSVTNFVIIAILAINSGAMAEDPIDAELGRCISQDWTTSGMMNCTNKGIANWDDRLNTVYKRLKSSLSPEEFKALQLSQQNWIKFRDSDFKSIDKIYEGMDGTMYLPMRLSEHLEIIKSRAVHLKALLEMKTENN